MFTAEYFSQRECNEQFNAWRVYCSDVATKAKSCDMYVNDAFVKANADIVSQLDAIDALTDEQDKAEKIRSCFRSFLVFGTGGLRGIMGAGINRINIYTIGHATQAFAYYILSRAGSDNARPSIVIGYDTRNNSRLYAQTAASVMAANGIKVFLFSEIRPTPEVSFAIRELGTTAGINVTASHNPKQYNGYKVYGSNGAQLLEKDADIVRSFMLKTDIVGGIKFTSFDDAVAKGDISFIDSSIDNRFLDAIFECLAPDEKMRRMLGDMKFVYTPVHGAGYKMIPMILERSGVKKENIHVVAEQNEPNGDFPSAWFPNPELSCSYELSLKVAQKHDDDYIIISDPDADRVGIAIRNPDGWFTRLTGNQIGTLMLDYLIKTDPAGKMKNPEPYAIKTFVTSDLFDRICALNNVRLFTVHTGFKYIAEVIEAQENRGIDGKSYILGFEESLGFLPGTFARDKDSVSSSLLLNEIAAYYKAKGMSMYEALEAMYAEYGCFYEETLDHYMLDDPSGLTGEQQRDRLMQQLRADPPMSFGGEKVVSYGDYWENKNDSTKTTKGILNTLTGERTATGTTDTDMLIFITENGHRVCIRPSGTEPKVKTYFLMNGAVSGLDDAQLRERVQEFKKTAYEYGMITEDVLAPYSYELPRTAAEFDAYNTHLRGLITKM